MSELKAHQKPTRSQVAAWEHIGRELHRAHCSMPTGRSRERICQRRGWLLAAAELMPGGWVREIPPPPQTED